MNIVKDTDKGYNNLLKLMKQQKVSADIGIFYNAGQVDGVSIAEYATYNEYGAVIRSVKARMWLGYAMNQAGIKANIPTGNIVIPERSFLRSTFDEQEKNAFRVIGADLKISILKPGFSLSKPVAKGAEFMRSEVVKKIKTALQWAKPNRPFTIAMKGKNQPLINKGIMWKAVTWKIVKIGG